MPDRMLSASICESETIEQLSWFGEVLFYRLIVRCDDRGRFDARPKIVKNLLFPLKDEMSLSFIEDGLRELEQVGLIKLYGDGRYLYLPSWEKFQRVRFVKPRYPDPSEGPEDVQHNAAGCDNLRQSAADCSGLPQSAAECSELPQGAAECGKLRLSRARAEEKLSIISSSSNISPSSSTSELPRSDKNEVPVEVQRAHAREGSPEAAPNAFADNPDIPSAKSLEAYISNYVVSTMTASHWVQLDELLRSGMPEELVRLAIDEACGQGKASWAYVHSILKHWAGAGIKTVGQVRQQQAAFKAGKSTTARASPGRRDDQIPEYKPIVGNPFRKGG